MTPQDSKRDEPETEEQSPRYVGYNRRVLATMLDMMLVIMLLLPLSQWLQDSSLSHLRTPEEMQAFLLATLEEPIFWAHYVSNLLVQFSLFAAYAWLCWLLWGTSPGKWVAGIRIVTIHDKSAPSALRFTLRAFAYILMPALTGIVFVKFALYQPLVMAVVEGRGVQMLVYAAGLMLCAASGFIWIAVDRQKRGLHDYIAGTVVISDLSGYRMLWQHIRTLWQHIRTGDKPEDRNNEK